MAEFLDSGSPGFVTAPNGLLVDVNTLGPGDTVVRPVAGAAPNVPAPAPVAAPMTAADVLAKRDRVLPPTPGLVTSSVSTTTTPGVSAAVLQPVLDRNTATGERSAAAVERAGDERATRREGAAMADNAQAFGRQQTAVVDEQQAEQRAAIARQNELALSLQKDPEIDPDRYVRGMSTGQSIGTVILAAVNGAFKGMVGQQGNDVMDILKTRVEQDIAAQREQLQSGRIRRGNLISYFQNQGLREDAAAKAAEATSWAMLERMANNERDRALAGDERTSAELLGEQIRGQVQAKNDELLLTLGTPRSQTTVTQERPKPAATSMADLANEMKGARDVEQLAKSGLTQPEFDKQKTEYSEKVAKNDDLVSRAREVAQALGGDVVETRNADGSVTYEVTGDLDTPHFGDDATRYESAVSNLQRADVMGMAREPSAKLQDQFAQAADMPFRDTQKKARIQQILTMAARERKNLQAGYNPHVTGATDASKDTGGIPGGWK